MSYPVVVRDFVLLIFILIAGSCVHPKEHSSASGPNTVEVLPASFQDTVLVSDHTWTLAEIMGKLDPALDTAFALVDKMYADREGLYLRKETLNAFIKMHDAASSAGIKLIIRSATRNFDYQKRIWEGKWTGETKLESAISASDIQDHKLRAQAILRYSSMPGTSRHHWGTDLDLNAFNNAYFETGMGAPIYVWLVENAKDYGFCQPYTEKNILRPDGYEEEKWHWSYTPLAGEILHSAKSLLRDDLITGFQGAEVAKDLEVVQHYVLGINPDCMAAEPDPDR